MATSPRAEPAATEAGTHYPGTHFAGAYNRLAGDIGGLRAERLALRSPHPAGCGHAWLVVFTEMSSSCLGPARDCPPTLEP